MSRSDVKESAVIGGVDSTGREAIEVLVTLKTEYKLELKDKESKEEEIRDFVNLRVEPRKRVKRGGVKILDGPDKMFSFDTEQEHFV